jgi:predicted DNA binding CopG/RHH family protein
LKQINVRLDEELLKKIKIICVTKELTLQEVVNTLLEKWVKENEG